MREDVVAASACLWLGSPGPLDQIACKYYSWPFTRVAKRRIEQLTNPPRIAGVGHQADAERCPGCGIDGRGAGAGDSFLGHRTVALFCRCVGYRKQRTRGRIAREGNQTSERARCCLAVGRVSHFASNHARRRVSYLGHRTAAHFRRIAREGSQNSERAHCCLAVGRVSHFVSHHHAGRRDSNPGHRTAAHF